MDGSWVTENLDSLWFYTNILPCRNETKASFLTHQFQPSIESPKREECESQKNVENVLCYKCGGEVGLVKGNAEVVRKSGRKNEKRERRTRRHRNEAEMIFGRLDLGFDVKEGNGFLSVAQLPPINDDVTMKQHLKSWAYDVACSIK